MSAEPLFLDTNILVYAVESGGPDVRKHALAKELVRRSNVILSTQVLGEFYTAVTHRRRACPMSHESATAWLQLWKRHDVRSLTVAHVDLALELRGRFEVHYFDALILASARFARCPVLYSEDLNAGQDYGGVLVTNPFVVPSG